ncbi:hypothetical protein VTK26DRAFT_2095 [Humicola hyalothermophila]
MRHPSQEPASMNGKEFRYQAVGLPRRVRHIEDIVHSVRQPSPYSDSVPQPFEKPRYVPFHDLHRRLPAPIRNRVPYREASQNPPNRPRPRGTPILPIVHPAPVHLPDPAHLLGDGLALDLVHQVQLGQHAVHQGAAPGQDAGDTAAGRRVAVIVIVRHVAQLAQLAAPVVEPAQQAAAFLAPGGVQFGDKF